MLSKPTSQSDFQHGLLKAIKALIGMPAEMLFYGSALLAIAATGGEPLTGVLATIGSTVGVNVLSNMLERIVRGDEVSEGEIRKIVEDAIQASEIRTLSANDEIQRAIAHLFRQFDLLKYAVHRGEFDIANILSEQFTQHVSMIEELQSELTYVREQNAEILRITKIQQSTLDAISFPTFSYYKFPTALVDQKIEDDLNIIRKARFFSEFDIVNSSLLLAKKLVDGDLGGGTDALRSRTLAWCVRILSSCNEIAKAEEYLKYAKDIGTGPEIEIAQAFVYSQKGDKNAALSILAIINENQ